MIEELKKRIKELDPTSSQAVFRLIYDISLLEVEDRITQEEGDELILMIRERTENNDH